MGGLTITTLILHLSGAQAQQTYLSKRGRGLRLLLSWEQGCGDWKLNKSVIQIWQWEASPPRRMRAWVSWAEQEGSCSALEASDGDGRSDWLVHTCTPTPPHTQRWDSALQRRCGGKA